MKLAWLVMVLVVSCTHGDKKPTPAPVTAPIEVSGKAAYDAKNWARCATLYLAEKDLYNAACCQALAGQRDAAFATLDKLVANDFRDLAHFQADTDLASLHADPRWGPLVAGIEANIAKLEASIQEPALRREIFALREEDQAARQAMIANQRDAAAIARVEAIDKKSTARMKEIVAKHGWPGKSLIGEDAARTAWLLVQHADKDIAFQKECLGLLEKAAAAGEARPMDYAYLYDRVAIAEKRPQRYGTQFSGSRPMPIEDEPNVDARRKAVGLPSMAEYAKGMAEVYGGGTFFPTTK